MTAGADHSVATNNNWTIVLPLHSSTKYIHLASWNGLFIDSSCNLTICRRHCGLIYYKVFFALIPLQVCSHLFRQDDKGQSTLTKMLARTNLFFHTLEPENPHPFTWLCHQRIPCFNWNTSPSLNQQQVYLEAKTEAQRQDTLQCLHQVQHCQWNHSEWKDSGADYIVFTGLLLYWWI